ncbi:hypothetical protein [Clostridium sulfidigenes]|uniref:hypothetical protein n=1 Tax=Clostridium sulfidigenes TaxID=318464 RepID=UPI003F89B758
MVRNLIGTVKDIEEYKDIKGLNLLVTQIGEMDPMIIGPIDYEEIEQFYKISYDTELKELISNNYNYCIWYVLNENCELINEINIDKLENIREATEEDLKQYNENIEKFKNEHGYYKIEEELEKNHIEEEKSKTEFENLDKSFIDIRYTEDEKGTVAAVMYKGYAVHYPINSYASGVSITILKGKWKGKMICTCNFREYKSFIDKIVEKIGDRPLEEDNFKDIEIVREILNEGRY